MPDSFGIEAQQHTPATPRVDRLPHRGTGTLVALQSPMFELDEGGT